MMSTKEKLRLDFQTFGSIAAMVVGVAALFVAWDQSRVMRAQQHASVWPILTVDRGYDLVDDEVIFEFSVQNAGVGPALLKRAALRNDGKDLAAWSDLGDFPPDDVMETKRTFGSSIEGRALAPSESFTPFRLLWDADGNGRTKIATISKAFKDIELDICYCSVFERCWAMSSIGSEPREQDSCADDAGGIN